MRDQRLWTWHVAAGVVVLVLLGLHMAIMHVDTILGVFNQPGTEAIEWTNVAGRARSAFYLVTYVVLLGAALFHGLYGLRNILFELDPGARLKQGLSVLLTIVGVGLFGLGAWAAWASFGLARAL
jgi:succinate dehydrogenase / fumarate reductase membrane anchor subunit